ncbi:MAG: hypothetical protein ACI9MC_002841 [Kiritimatiellia bacterium]|jgi:hypothetical protein
MPAMLGSDGRWPLAGHLFGSMQSDDLQVSWAGRVGAGDDDPVLAWRACRALQRAIHSSSPPTGDHRLGLAVLWARIESCAHLGPNKGADLHLLLTATSASGTAISAVGIEHLFGAEPEGPCRAWVRAPHPLFGPPGLPKGQTGALIVHTSPSWLIATTGENLDGQLLSDALPRCGVHR